MLKHYENKNRTNENEVEENSSQGKGGFKQFGLSSSQTNKSFGRNAEMGLKIKSNSQEIIKSKGDKNSLKSALPQKRTESIAGLRVRPDPKKQHIQPIEKTHRHREQEIEWAPEGLDLDFSAFNSSPYESYSQTKEAKLDLDDYPVLTRRFTVDQKEKEEIITTTLIEAVQDIEHDTTRIEYGPPKEIEIPYLPNESCIVDFNAFNGYADPSAYESTRLYNNDKLEFSVFDDLDALAQLTDDTSLEFTYYCSDDELEMTTDEDTDIPFSNHLFDVDHFIQCN